MPFERVNKALEIPSRPVYPLYLKDKTSLEIHWGSDALQDVKSLDPWYISRSKLWLSYPVAF